MKNISDNKIPSVYFSILNEEFNFEESGWRKKVTSLSPTYRKLISILVFSSSILSGWFLAPSKKRIISFGFSALAGAASFVALKKFNIKNNTDVKKEIIETLEEKAMTLEDIALDPKDSMIDFSKLIKKFRLTTEELKVEKSEIYKKFLEILLRNPDINLEEIKELINLKNYLGLAAQDAGNCHYEFAQDLYKNYIIMIERENSDEFKKIIDKFFFLSDRIFEMDLPKGYQYESARLRKIFPYSEKDIKRECLEKATNLYEKLIENVLDNENPKVSKIKSAGKILGLKEEKTIQIHNEFYQKKIAQLLSQEDKITKKGKAQLEKIKNLLDVTEQVSEKYIVEKTGPLFSKEAILILENTGIETTEQELKEMAQKIKNATENFFLKENIAYQYFSSAVETIFYQCIEKIIKSIKAKKTNEALEGVKKLLFLEKNINIISKLIFSEQKTDEKNVKSNFSYDLRSNFKLEDVRKIYSIYLEECLVETELSSENEKNLLNLEKILGFSSEESREIYDASVGPILYQKIKNIFQNKKIDSEDKKEIEILEVGLKIDKKVSTDIKLNLYKELLEISQSKNTIFTKEEEEKFENLRRSLSLSWNDVQKFHDLTSEKKYQKSISEALGATGIIPKNYWQGLENLRKKLQLSETKAKEIFYSSIQNKLKINFEKAIAENKKKKQAKESADLGEDPTITKGAGTALGIEAGDLGGNQLLGLIDIYSRNRIYIENEKISNKINQNSLLGQNGRSEKKNCTRTEIEYTYPVNLDGLFSKKITTELYRDYLVECFSVKSQNEKRKLFNNLNRLGPLLGLSVKEVEDIHSSVGSLVYKQYLSQALNKGFLDKSDMAFLSNIQTTLSMNSEKCSNFIKEAKKNKIALLVESIFVTPKINPSRVSEMRKIAKQLGVDLAKDIDVSAEQKSKMFKIEIDSGIEKGLISIDNQELINEIQTSIGLEDDVARKVLLNCISSRCENYLLNAVASLRKGSISEVIQEMEKMLNFGKLLPIYVKNPIASKKERIDLYSIYQTEHDEKIDEKTYGENLKLLKKMLGIE